MCVKTIQKIVLPIVYGLGYRYNEVEIQNIRLILQALKPLVPPIIMKLKIKNFL